MAKKRATTNFTQLDGGCFQERCINSNPEKKRNLTDIQKCASSQAQRFPQPESAFRSLPCASLCAGGDTNAGVFRLSRGPTAALTAVSGWSPIRWQDGHLEFWGSDFT